MWHSSPYSWEIIHKWVHKCGFWPDVTTILIGLRSLSKQHQGKKSTNTLKLFVRPKSTSQGESIKSNKLVEDNIKNHSRQKRTVYKAPQNPSLNWRVWIYLRSNLFVVRAEEINVRGSRDRDHVCCFLIYQEMNSQTAMQYLDRHRASCNKDIAHRALSSPEVKLGHNHSSKSVFSKAPAQSLLHSMWATLSTVGIYFHPQILDKSNHCHYME